MLRRILVPTDFSDVAEAALRHAAALARQEEAALRLVTAISDLEFGHGAPPEGHLSRARTRAMVDIDALALPLRDAGIDVDWRVVEDRPHAAIRSAALEFEADLIAMGTHGRTGIAHAALGSTTERALGCAPCPVLTIRGDGHEPSPVRTLAVATDFSEPARAALDWAAALAASWRADLVLIHVVSEGGGTVRASARKELETLSEGIGELVSEMVVEVGPAPAGILSAAARFGCDAIAIGASGRSALRRAVLGSTAQRVIRAARVPVLTYCSV